MLPICNSIQLLPIGCHKTKYRGCNVKNMQYPDNDEIAPNTIPPLQGKALKYKPTLDSFISFVHNQGPYTREKTYTKAELRALTPQNVLFCMNLKTFGVLDPQLMRILLRRGETHLHFEKTIIPVYAQLFASMGFRSGQRQSNEENRDQQRLKAGEEEGSLKTRCGITKQAGNNRR